MAMAKLEIQLLPSLLLPGHNRPPSKSPPPLRPGRYRPLPQPIMLPPFHQHNHLLPSFDHPQRQSPMTVIICPYPTLRAPNHPPLLSRLSGTRTAPFQFPQSPFFSLQLCSETCDLCCRSAELGCDGLVLCLCDLEFVGEEVGSVGDGPGVE